MEISGNVLIMIPAEDLESLKRGIQQIINQLDQLIKAQSREKTIVANYITGQEFMDAVHIRRWKFNQLIVDNKIKTIKKKRKIYVPARDREVFH
jgi:SAM-dependent MidA family methyltransferase